MKKIFIFCVFLFLSHVGISQNNAVNLAAIAWEKGHFENAWENANAALQSQEKLGNEELYKAYSIRGKAGARITYDALTKMEDSNTEKYAGMALQSFSDFKKLLDTQDSALIGGISKEFYKLGHALLLSGTDYDAINADKETPDSSLLDKAMDCYSATIELWELAGKVKYKPYYYRGDILLAKKKYEEAMKDLTRAMEIYIASNRKNPDLGVGDLGYRIAYTQAGVYNKKEEALKTIEKTRGLLDAEMQLAETKKESLSEVYADLKSEYDYLIGELNNLKSSVTK